MQIRTRLTLQFAVTVAAILVFLFISIYFFSSNYRKQEFNSRLHKKAYIYANFLKDSENIENDVLKIESVDSVNTIPSEKVFVYNATNKLIYCCGDKYPIAHTDEIINKTRSKKELILNNNGAEELGLSIEGKQENLVLIVSAFDKFGFSKLKYLQLILIFSFLLAVGLIFLFGLIYAKQALVPIVRVVSQVENITINNLDLRVDEGNGTDEIARLAIEFNKMLERLETSFEIQRSFVENASHELRTPLTAITGQIEVALMDKNINNETREVLQSILFDILSLNKLSNGLLELVQTGMDTSKISFDKIRIDELIGLIIADLSKKNKEYKVSINFDRFPKDETQLIIVGNEQLLKIAIINILENACKYSFNKEAFLNLDINTNGICLNIEDQGIGIPQQDLERVFYPFFRSENAKTFSGHGIGLALTESIVKLHKGTIKITSTVNIGTLVNIFLPY